jgi:hypothetical protein
MREYVPAIWDDLDLLDDPKSRNPAAVERYVGWEGNWKVLDLNDAHDREVSAYMERLMSAGTTPDKSPSPRRRQTEAAARNARIVEWAKAHGHKTTPRGRGQGSDYIPVKTLRAFEEYEAAHGVGGDRSG